MVPAASGWHLRDHKHVQCRRPSWATGRERGVNADVDAVCLRHGGEHPLRDHHAPRGGGGERGAGDVLSGRRSGGGRGSAALGPAHVGGVPLRPAGAARLGEHEHDLRADDGRGVCDEWGAAHDLGRGSGAGRDPGADRWGELGGVGQRIPDVSGPVLDVGPEPLLRAGGVRAGAGGGPTAERDALRLQGQPVGREPDVAALHVAGVLGRAGDAIAGAVQRRGAVPAVHGGGGAGGVPGAGRGHGAAVCVRYVAVHGGSVSAGARGLLTLSWHGSLLQEKREAGGLIYQRNRLYDPKSGRFTQEDPIGLAGGLNLYGYAGGDPVNFSDPFGLFDIEVQGENSKRIVSYLLRNSSTFRDAYNRLDRDKSVHLTIRDANDPLGAGVERNSFTLGAGWKSGTIIFNGVGLNQANFDLFSKDPGSKWMFTAASVMGHEMGHASAWLGKGAAACRSDSPPGCILRFENQVRSQLPANAQGGTRTRYNP
ncbi:MAG: RHS repeat-associated core domain-containing protein [Gemmatimonadetes bacterium]|nr:RHS repeat-associated core domain-containing protein [Gemmatimonadota bacterium]